MLQHTIDPVYDSQSKVLILGSFPSVKSREQQFFYGHKQNRFWRVMAQVLGCRVPEDIPQKREMLLAHHVAVWDVIASCEITGSSDASIRDAAPNDLTPILNCADIRAIFLNGGKAGQLYQKYIFPVIGREACILPSTSPANAGYSFEKLVEAWQVMAGESVRLSWKVSGADSVYLNPGNIPLSLAGTRRVCVNRSGIFTLCARKDGQTEARELAVYTGGDAVDLDSNK